MEILILSVGVFAALLAGFFAFRGAFFGADRQMSARLAELRMQVNAATGEETPASLKRQDPGDGRRVDTLAKRFLPRQSALKDRLARTGKQISMGQYALICVLIALVVSAVLFLIASLPLIAALAGGTALGIAVPHFVVGRMAVKRQKKFIALFPDAIDLMVRGLRSGLPISECVATVGREVSDPVGIEFRQVSDSVRFGRQLDEALWDMANRLNVPEVKFFVISLSVQQETGGNLAETLANLSDILRRRRQMKLKVSAMSSEAKASAYILGLLPFIMMGIIYTLNPEYASVLFTDLRGRLMLLAGGAIMSVGIFVMSRMVSFEI